jgi:hypothetical protein
VLPVVGTVGGGVVGGVVGGLGGLVGGFLYGRKHEKELQEDEAETEAALEESEEDVLQLMQRQAREDQAVAQRATAQGQILGGDADALLFDSASTGANLEGFKRRNFPTYG